MLVGGNDLIKVLEKDEALLKQPNAAEAVEETKTLFKYLEILGITHAVISIAIIEQFDQMSDCLNTNECQHIESEYLKEQ